MATRSSATTLASELWDDELMALLDFAKNASNGGRYLEVGTAAGGTLCEMMKCFNEMTRPQFVVVDTMAYFADQLEIVKRNLRSHKIDADKVDFRVSTSSEAFKKSENMRETFDFMLIDGAHKIRYVTQDLSWLRLLKVGGVACFHDYNDKHKGVKWPLDRFLKKNIYYRREKLVSNLLVIRKIAPSAIKEITFSDKLWAALLSPILQFELSLSKRLKRGRN